MATGTDYLINVPLTTRNNQFSATLSSSASAFVDAGGAYNMKCTGAWIDIYSGANLAVGTFLYGQDEILFGPVFEATRNSVNLTMAKISSIAQVARGETLSVASGTVDLTTAASKNGLHGTKLKTQAFKGSIEQRIE